MCISECTPNTISGMEQEAIVPSLHREPAWAPVGKINESGGWGAPEDWLLVEVFKCQVNLYCVSSKSSIILYVFLEVAGSHGIRKHLTGGFLCAVLDLSGIFWSLLIPKYSGIKRRGTPFPELRNPGISFISFSIR